MNFLGNFSTAAKPRVYLSVTPGVGLEMIELDFSTKSVSNYACRELTYNETSRNILDYERFKLVLGEMFEELNINPNCEIIINMPLVSFGRMEFQLFLPDSSITGAIQSEVEQSYIFRKAEPVITWQDIPSAQSGGNSGQGNESRQVIYSAIQKEVITAMEEVFASFGATLLRVENSLVSTLRALDFAGFTQNQMQPNVTWNLMIITVNGFSIVSMSGKNITDYYDEPLAFKSFEGDEIYSAITQSAEITLMSCPANYLFIVSDTDSVSASLLASKLKTQSSVTVLENNSYKKDNLIPVGLNVLNEYNSKISLQAIGAALADASDYPVFLHHTSIVSKNYMESCTFSIGEKEITLTQNAAYKLVGIFAAVLLIPTVLLSFLLMPKLIETNKAKLKAVEKDIADIDKELENYESVDTSSVFNYVDEVKKGVKGNRAKLMNFVAAGDAIPKTVALTYFMTQGDGLVDLKGVSSNIEDVYVFFKNMQDSLVGSKLRLQKLEMMSASVDEAVSGASGSGYNFEITNMTDDQLNALLNIVNDAAGNVTENAQNNANAKDKKSTKEKKTSDDKKTADVPAETPQSDLLSKEPIKK